MRAASGLIVPRLPANRLRTTKVNHESAKDESPKEEFASLSGFRLSRFRD
jgi:hypothetical protein